jgi:hypothetical protein
LQLVGRQGEEPDIEVDVYKVMMAFLATVDAWFFVVYAHFLDKYGSLFSVRIVIS